MGVFYNWMNTLMTCGLPSFWILVFNVAIIWSLVTRSRFTQPTANPGSRTNNSQVAILITVSVTFVVLSTPMAVYFCFIAYAQNKGVFPTGVTMQQMLMLGNFAPIFDSIHHSIYFVFYCLCGAKFRRSLMKQLRWAFEMCRFTNAHWNVLKIFCGIGCVNIFSGTTYYIMLMPVVITIFLWCIHLFTHSYCSNTVWNVYILSVYSMKFNSLRPSDAYVRQ